MKITIDDSYERDFIYFIPGYILKLVRSSLNDKKCQRFKDEFGIDVAGAISYAIRTLSINRVNDYYTISIDRNRTYKGMNIEKLINLITYGNRSVKGYTILLNIFNFITEHPNVAYMEWKSHGN